MKTKLILLLTVMVMMVTGAMAQEAKHKRKHHGIMEHKTEIGLSDSQVTHIKAIHMEYASKMKELKKAENPDKIAVKKLMGEKRSAIEQTLTSEQLEKWKTIKAKDKSAMKNPELRKEMKTYKDKNIKPVLLEKRKTFDSELSADEKTVIADLRAKHQALRGSKVGPNKDDNYKAEMKKRRMELKEETNKTLKPIMDKHAASLEKINADLTVSREQWKKDMEAIKAKHKVDSKSKPSHKAKKGGSKDKSSIGFILMDPEGKK